MAEPTLQFLGEQIARIEAEFRDLGGVRADVVHLRADMGNMERAIDSQFVQVRQTMTVNPEVLLAALAAKA